jgi:outer membrane immunogenic protein
VFGVEKMSFVRAGALLAVIMGLTHPAAAADMPVKALPAPAFSWTGFYAGVHAGWGWNDPTGTSTIHDAGTLLLTAQHDLGANGPLFGGHIGYNWQINPTLVVGIEGDITGTGINTSSAQPAFCPPTSLFCATPQAVPGALISMSQDVNWLASIRGRLGTTGGLGLIYVTGGAAWANVDYKAAAGDSTFVCSNLPGCTYQAESSTTKTGWAAGAGYETTLGGNWTVRAEYLYYSFGGETLTAVAPSQAGCIPSSIAPCVAAYTFSDLKIHTVRAGLTYKFGQAPGAPMAAFAAFAPRGAAPVRGWTGFYAGLDTGWGFSSPTATSIVTAAGIPALTSQHDLGANGPLFGGHLGYNWQINPTLVAGIEADITGTGIKTSSAQTPFCSGPAALCTGTPLTNPFALMTMSEEVNWLASIRGRLGTTWGLGLIYVTGGAAWTNVDYKANTGDGFAVCSAAIPGNNGCAFPAASNITKTGFAVGGGYETALVGNWTVRAEYLYYSFGGETLTATGKPQTNCGGGPTPPCAATYTFPDLKIHTARLGLGYKF